MQVEDSANLAFLVVLVVCEIIRRAASNLQAGSYVDIRLWAWQPGSYRGF
jgi:hypothetical protein